MSKYQQRQREYRSFWYKLRWQVLTRAGGMCENPQGCCRPALQIHHLYYPVGRREEMRDLIALCDECHARAHGYWNTANDNEPQLPLDKTG